MKTARELLLQRHQAADAKLDRIRNGVVSQLTKTTARAAQDAPTNILHTLWRELFWPSRYAWGGLAAAWLALLAVNQSMYSADAGRPADAAPTMEIIEAAQTQRRMLAELAEPIAEHAVDRAKNIHLRPQSRNESNIVFT